MQAKLVKFIHLRRFVADAKGAIKFSSVSFLRHNSLLGYMLHTGGTALGVVYNKAKKVYGLVSVHVSTKDIYNKKTGRIILNQCVNHMSKLNTSLNLDKPQSVRVPLNSYLKEKARRELLENTVVEKQVELNIMSGSGKASSVIQSTADQLSKLRNQLSTLGQTKKQYEYRFCWYSNINKMLTALSTAARVMPDSIFEPLKLSGCYQIRYDGACKAFRLVVLGIPEPGHFTVAFISTDAPYNRWASPATITSLYLTPENRKILKLDSVALVPFKEKYVLQLPVGAAPMTVTKLGRSSPAKLKINTGAKTLKLVTVASGK